MFWKKKDSNVLNSGEYESLAKKIVELSTAVENLLAKLTRLDTELHSLRGTVNRKIYGPKEEEKKEEPEQQQLNTSFPIPFDGNIR